MAPVMSSSPGTHTMCEQRMYFLCWCCAAVVDCCCCWWCCRLLLLRAAVCRAGHGGRRGAAVCCLSELTTHLPPAPGTRHQAPGCPLPPPSHTVPPCCRGIFCESRVEIASGTSLMGGLLGLPTVPIIIVVVIVCVRVASIRVDGVHLLAPVKQHLKRPRVR